MNCEICHKTFDNKRSLTRHYYYHVEKDSSFKSVVKKHISNLKKKGNNKCVICHEYFSTQQALKNHIDTVCRDRQLSIVSDNTKRMCELTEYKMISDDMKFELHKLAVENAKILNTVKNSKNIYAIGSINNNTINNFQGSITAVGDNNNNTTNTINNNFAGVRSIDNLNEDMYNRPLQEDNKKIREIFKNKESMNDVDKMFLTVDRFFNCNQDYPENHNIIVTDKRTDVPCMVKINDAWTQQNEAQMKTHFGNRIVNCGVLCETYIPQTLKEMFPAEADEIDRIADSISGNWDDGYTELKERLWHHFFLQTYNHRDILIETYKNDQKLLENRQSTPAVKKSIKMRVKSNKSNKPVIKPTYQVKSM